MAFKLEWKAVLQPLALQDYHAEYAENVIQVCVNPTPTFWQERTNLQTEWTRRYEESLTQLREQEGADEAAAIAFATWAENDFLKEVNRWFAVLWSYGSEPWSLDDLHAIEETDPHLLTWLKQRSIQMIEEHAAGRKKK